MLFLMGNDLWNPTKMATLHHSDVDQIFVVKLAETGTVGVIPYRCKLPEERRGGKPRGNFFIRSTATMQVPG
jgi:hypothetical protein